jgi:hypothetical protein
MLTADTITDEHRHQKIERVKYTARAASLEAAWQRWCGLANRAIDEGRPIPPWQEPPP